MLTKDIPPADIEKASLYEARLLAHGVDTWVETYNLDIPEGHWLAWKQYQDEARKGAGHDGDGGRAFEFGHRIYRMRPFGGGGCAFIIEGADCTLSIRPEGMRWNVSARFSSHALWTRGLMGCLDDLDADFSAAKIKRVEESGTSSRCSRLDYAFDFHCERFTREARPDILSRFVLPGGCKAAIYTSGNGSSCRVETIRVGKLPGLQLEIYDKGREIVEVSGKSWMRRAWRLEESAPLDDIWRIEVRFGSEFFKARHDLRRSDNVILALPFIVAGGLYDRRLTAGSKTRARRAQPHPLFEIARHAVGNPEFTPKTDDRPTLSRADLRGVIQAQIAGLVRADSVLAHSEYSDDHARVMAARAEEIIAADRSHAAKTDRVRERYRWLDKGK